MSCVLWHSNCYIPGQLQQALAEPQHSPSGDSNTVGVGPTAEPWHSPREANTAKHSPQKGSNRDLKSNRAVTDLWNSSVVWGLTQVCGVPLCYVLLCCGALCSSMGSLSFMRLWCSFVSKETPNDAFWRHQTML